LNPFFNSGFLNRFFEYGFLIRFHESEFFNPVFWIRF
jgi:hypothetical protein